MEKAMTPSFPFLEFLSVSVELNEHNSWPPPPAPVLLSHPRGGKFGKNRLGELSSPFLSWDKPTCSKQMFLITLSLTIGLGQGSSILTLLTF